MRLPPASRYRRFYRRLLPALFAVICVLIIVSGSAYFMDSHDAMSYRIPRIYEWLNAHHWYWIDTLDQRQNNRGTGVEWMSLPIILITGTDRLVFLVNFISYLFLPYLIFDTFILLGIKRKVAWYWMWLAPTGLCFVLQAQTCANDVLAGFFVLVAVNLALRAARFQRPDILGLALLSYALSLGVKLPCLLLVLPFACAVFPALPLAGKWPPLFAGALLSLIFFSSFAPNAIFNYLACGDWTGLKLDLWAPPLPTTPLVKLPVNGFLILYQNFSPPVFPFYQAYRHWLDGFLQTSLGHFLSLRFEKDFMVGRPVIRVDTAAMGPGVMFAVLFGMVATVVKDRGWLSRFRRIDYLASVRLAGFVSFLALLSVSNLCQIGRLGSTFYLLAIPFLVATPVHERLVRSKFWRALPILNSFVVIFFLIFCPLRPLFPLNASLALTKQTLGENSRFYQFFHNSYAIGLSRLDDVYWMYDCVPPGVHRIGQVRAWMEKESPFWYPYRSKQVFCIRREETPQSIRAKGITYVELTAYGLYSTSNYLTAEEWCQHYDAHEVSRRLCEDNDMTVLVALNPWPN